MIEYNDIKISHNDKRTSYGSPYFNTFIFIILFSSLGPIFDGVRYVKYLVPVVAVLFYIRVGSMRIVIDNITKPFLILMLFAIPFIWRSNAYGLYDMYFMFSYLLVYLLFKVPRYNVRKLGMLVACLYLLDYSNKMFSGFEFSFIESKSSIESHQFGFVFGLFCVFFITKKDWLFSIIFLIFSILSLKRIVLFAVAVVFVVSFLPDKIKKIVFDRYMLISLVLSFVFVAYFITTEMFDEIVIQYYGVNADYLTMGRTILYRGLFDGLFSDILNILVGAGPGASYEVASFSLYIVEKENIHSDILKLLYENGFLCLVVFLYVLFKPKVHSVVLINLYVTILFMTDNVISYTFVMFFYFLICYQLLYVESDKIGEVN
ncbi:MAG: hypothetical protein ACJAWL_002384 [Motiliproteus sp.]